VRRGKPLARGTKRLVSRARLTSKPLARGKVVLRYGRSRKAPVTDALRTAVLRRDGYRCRYCGRPGEPGRWELEIDHIRSKSKGGLATMNNLVTACVTCNRDKGTQEVLAWASERGFIHVRRLLQEIGYE
jgi:5-methylcytosine-specific restriction endonuclease McrA